MISSQHKKNISTTLHRGMVLVLLLCSLAIGVKAQKYYVIYYDEVKWNATIRHYVSISEDGTSIVDETTLSSRCFWKAESALKTAEGEKGINLKNTETNTTNQNNRIKLSSVTFPKKFIVESSSATEADIANGKSYSLTIRETSVTPRWLIDNEIDEAPILYQYYHKQYLYYEYGWKYSSAGYKTGSVAKLLVYDAIPNDLPSPSSTVTLDDCENHSWTYYSGIEPGADPSDAPNISGDSYNERYAGKLYSPQPRNVKITYNANGGAVSITEPETSFVYHKTLEQGDTEGEYPYTVISNPFSKRPTGKGFGGWQIISGGNYIKGYDNDNVLPLDAEIVFENLPYDDVNCISAEIELEATWVNLNNIVRRTDTGAYEYSTSGGTYETNILVLKGNQTGTITIKSPCTIMMVEPDGSIDYRNEFTFTGSIVPFNNTPNDAEGNTKIEYAHWNPVFPKTTPTNETKEYVYIDAMGRNFTIGRGMEVDGINLALYGTNTAIENVNQILKVESGTFTIFEHFGAKPKAINKQRIVLGCDYDRAKHNNNNLKFTSWMRIAHNIQLPTDSDDEICRVYAQSGSFMTGVSVSDANAGNCYYFNVRGTTEVKGYRYLEILGGEWKNIAGGWATHHTNTNPAFTFRMKGGHILGSIYGGAEYQAASGTRNFIITGGTIKGWVAGGSNGTQTGGGIMNGESFIYVGGDAQINSKGSTTLINRAVGGNVFGAGCGYDATSESGQVTLGTNVVIADNAYVERGVYGGGSYGYCPTDKTANIYITGGTVGGNVGGVEATGETKAYTTAITGGVYGGACQNKGGHVNIFMTGGTVNGGIYGGSNASGVLSGSVNMTIAGGTVGTQGNAASVFGGGYGSGTTINGSTSITMTGGTINGNLFGGGNQGAVNSNTSVTITGGSVTGNVYGGGNKATVSGTTSVVIGRSNDQQNSSN